MVEKNIIVHKNNRQNSTGVNKSLQNKNQSTKVKKSVFAAFMLLVTMSVSAQSLQQGLTFINYERNASAIEVLKKVVAASPTDVNGVYWLGQAYIKDDKLAEAKELYQKALQGGMNQALIWVGMGHVELLMNGDKNAARQQFEQAITSTKGKKGAENPEILNAVGRANADGNSTQGDAIYGSEVLKRAAAIDLKNPDIPLNLGMCYLKMGSEFGGQAVEAFRDATMRNPQFARGYYRMGRIYQAQNNKESMVEQYDKAITADPSFAPVYLSYFLYYQERDVNEAKKYLDLYVANTDADCNVDFFVANYLFRAGKYQESIDKAKIMETGACANDSRLKVLYAFNYDRLGDSVQALSNVEQFLTTTPVEKIEPVQYDLAGKIMARFPGNEAKAVGYLEKAMAADTSREKKLQYLATISGLFEKAKMYHEQLNTLMKIPEIKGTCSARDYFVMCSAARNAKSFSALDSISKEYISKYPDQTQGYSFNVSAAKGLDADTTKGLAVEPIKAHNTIMMKDLEKNRKTIYNNCYYLLVYYAQYAKQMDKAIAVTDEMIALYPDETSEERKFAQDTRLSLTNAVNRQR
jgi:tetratricopeptide (TPR) repeat protein